MIHQSRLWCLVFALLLPGYAYGQRTFQNLDFEDALVTAEGLASFTLYTDAEVIPGWAFDAGDYQTTNVFQHLSCLPQRYLSHELFGDSVLAGDFSVALAAGFVDQDCENGTEGVGIFQTAFLPQDALSIRLLASQGPETIDGVDSWALSLEGIELDLVRLGNTEWGGNLPTFSQRRARELRIDVSDSYELDPFQAIHEFPIIKFDNIRFSPVAINVPEPGTGCVLVLGSILLPAIRRRDPSGVSLLRSS